MYLPKGLLTKQGLLGPLGRLQLSHKEGEAIIYYRKLHKMS